MRKRELRAAVSWMALAATHAAALAAQAPAPTTPVAPQQEASPSTTPASANSDHPAHQIKIWTNEDLLETRTPADRYIFAKEEKAVADQAAEIQSLTSCFAPGNREPTQEETQQDIAETTRAITEAENGVAQAKRQVAEDPENLRTRDQAELNRRTAELNRLLEHLHTLQMRLQESNSQTGGPAAFPVDSPAASPADSPPPSSQPPPSL